MAMRGNGGLDSSEKEQQMVPAHEKSGSWLESNAMAMRGNGGLGSSEKKQQMVPAHEKEQIQEPCGRNLQLRFQSRLPDCFFTGKKVKRQGDLIRVQLIDTSKDHVVASGPLSSLKLDVVVLPGDFKNEDDDVRTWENFKSHVVKEREGKLPLLEGDLQVSLKEGVGSLGELKFTDNSSWTRSRKFRLGLKVESGFCEGIRVCEAISDAFQVKDRRGECDKKHDPPALDDELWRLKKIKRNGPFHNKLNEADIKTVREFLWKLGTDDQGLKQILGRSMSGKMWKTLVEHAKTCDLSGKYYVYYADNTKNSGVVFKNIHKLCGLIEGGRYYSAEDLSDSQKVSADSLNREACAKWKHIVEFEGLMDLNPNKKARLSPTNFVNEAPDQQVPPPYQALEDSGLVVGGAPDQQVPPPDQALEDSQLVVGAPTPCQQPSVPYEDKFCIPGPDFEDVDYLMGGYGPGPAPRGGGGDGDDGSMFMFMFGGGLGGRGNGDDGFMFMFGGGVGGGGGGGGPMFVSHEYPTLLGLARRLAHRCRAFLRHVYQIIAGFLCPASLGSEDVDRYGELEQV